MAATRYDIEKVDGQNDFSLWRIKMKALPRNLGLEEALDEEKAIPDTLTEEQKTKIRKQRKEINKKAFNTLILSLGEKVLREVSKMTTTEPFGRD